MNLRQRPRSLPADHRTHRRGQRGATMVEYALLVALIGLGTVAAISRLSDSAGAKMLHTAGQIGVVDPVPTTDGDGGGDAGGDAGPTTTAPPTTVPSTSTTMPPPSTTAPSEPVSGGGSLGSASLTTNRRDWSASVIPVITDTEGLPVAGAQVVVRLTVTATDGSVISTYDLSGTTDRWGSVTLRDGGRTQPGDPRAATATFSIVSVAADGFTWDGDPATTTVVA